MRVEQPIVGPGDRTSVPVYVLNFGTTTANNVTLKSTTLALTYAISDSLRLGALTVAVFTRSSPIDADDAVRRSAAWPEQPAPVAVRIVGEIAS